MNPFKRKPKGRTVLPSYESVRQSMIPDLPPPPTNGDKLREALRILNNLECEYEITICNMLFTRKNIKHGSY